MNVRPALPLALALPLAAGCITGDYNQTRVYQPVPAGSFDALVVGEASLTDALEGLGAPLQVVELGSGAALAWGWKEATDWNVTGSATLGSVRGRLSYSDTDLEFPGVVLFFDGSWNLVAKDEGFLSDLLPRPQLPRFLGADASGEGDA